MYRIALVEDELDAADALAAFLDRYAQERGLDFALARFTNAMDFELTKESFDLVFMDIQMPGINGMEAAHLLRTYDEVTPIVFVTNLAQYAVRGYEVDALDFIVKPVTYFNFRMRMDKAMRQNFVPVVDDQKNFIGIVTRRDIMQYICSSCGKESKEK